MPHGEVGKIGFICHQLNTSSAGKEGSRRDLVQNSADLSTHHKWNQISCSASPMQTISAQIVWLLLIWQWLRWVWKLPCAKGHNASAAPIHGNDSSNSPCRKTSLDWVYSARAEGSSRSYGNSFLVGTYYSCLEVCIHWTGGMCRSRCVPRHVLPCRLYTLQSDLLCPSRAPRQRKQRHSGQQTQSGKVSKGLSEKRYQEDWEESGQGLSGSISP